MASHWTGETDCPRCGSEGTLMVHGETATLEIEGCWVCGFGYADSERKFEFVPLNRIRVQNQGRNAIGA